MTNTPADPASVPSTSAPSDDPRWNQRRGLLFVISSPSGAGKTTLTRRLIEGDGAIRLSISATTRAPRPGEVEGVHYHFLDLPRFEAMVGAAALLEHAVVFGNRYGTPRAPVEAALAGGRDVLFDIDWQGARQVRAAMPTDTVTVFILPPSAGELERRLRARAADADDVIQRRMARAADEIGHHEEYDYVLVNDDLDRCLAELRAILAAERLRRARRPGLLTFVQDLQAAL